MTTKFEKATLNKIADCLKKIKFQSQNYNKTLLTSFEQQLEEYSASNLLEAITTSQDLTKKQKADLCFTAFLEKQELAFILKAGDLSTSYLFAGWAAKTLVTRNYEWSDRVKEIIESSSAWNYKIVKSFFENLDMSSIGLGKADIDYYGESGLLTPSKAHLLYQSCKAESAKTITEASKSHGWFNSVIKITYDKVSELGNYAGKKLYGYVSEQFSDPKWLTALSKGFAKSAIGHNGVKILDNKLLELKINADARLYTKTLHQNDQGDYLAVFDEQADHSEIARLVSQSKGLLIQEDCLSTELAGAASQTDAVEL